MEAQKLHKGMARSAVLSDNYAAKQMFFNSCQRTVWRIYCKQRGQWKWNGLRLLKKSIHNCIPWIVEIINVVITFKLLIPYVMTLFITTGQQTWCPTQRHLNWADDSLDKPSLSRVSKAFATSAVQWRNKSDPRAVVWTPFKSNSCNCWEVQVTALLACNWCHCCFWKGITV